MDADFLEQLTEACEPIFVRQLDVPMTKPKKAARPIKPSKHGYTLAFEEWFACYPNKVGKLDAFKAWPRALMQVQVEQEFDDEEEAIAYLTAAVQEYAVSDRARECPYNPATFLNGRHWDDDRSAWNRAVAEKPKKQPKQLKLGEIDP